MTVFSLHEIHLNNENTNTRNQCLHKSETIFIPLKKSMIVKSILWNYQLQLFF